MESEKQTFITTENYGVFRKAYEKAKEKGEEAFWFEDQKVLTAYAKYVVLYVESTKTN